MVCACAAGICASRPNTCGVSACLRLTRCPRRNYTNSGLPSASVTGTGLRMLPFKHTAWTHTRWRLRLDIDKRLHKAVQSYWDARAKNKEKQIQSGKIDAGTRGEVTGGTQMGALEILVADILCDAGLKRLDVRTRTALELPGYFRATKKWDLIVVSERQLVLAMEFKSQAGKSIGNNVNNRSEEAVGSAKDIWIAYREGRFGKSPAPFLGYFFLLEDRDNVKIPVTNKEPYFPVDPAFRGELTNSKKTRIIQPALDLSFQRFAAALRGHAVTFLESRKK